MGVLSPTDRFEIRLAGTDAEIEAAQRLRYNVFYDEQGAHASEETRRHRRDFDAFDSHADHLIVVDLQSGNRVIGTYRMLRRSVAETFGQFYSSDEYDITRLLGFHRNILEMGRSCVDRDYRTRPVLQILWRGIAEYVMHHDIQMLFGCASFPGVDPFAHRTSLSYLWHHHLAPASLRARALDSRYVDMNLIPADEIDPKRALAGLPPLIKGYIRLGCYVGDGAVIDHQFNTTDVCIILTREQIADRYLNHLTRPSPSRSGSDEPRSLPKVA